MNLESADATQPSSGSGQCEPTALRRAGSRWARRAGATAVALLLVVAGLNLWVLRQASGRLHAPDSPLMPQSPVALVLGTSPKRANGAPNRHFQHRMEAAAALFAAGKVTTLVVSGATDGRYYDEPRDMRADLIARGVPRDAIIEDREGVRTFDSVVRLKEHFHATHCAIISDAWHVPRALFIADHIGLHAIGVRARPVPWRQSLKARSREWLARVLVVLDLYVLGTRPENEADR